MLYLEGISCLFKYLFSFWMFRLYNISCLLLTIFLNFSHSFSSSPPFSSHFLLLHFLFPITVHIFSLFTSPLLLPLHLHQHFDQTMILLDIGITGTPDIFQLVLWQLAKLPLCERVSSQRANVRQSIHM